MSDETTRPKLVTVSSDQESQEQAEEQHQESQEQAEKRAKSIRQSRRASQPAGLRGIPGRRGRLGLRCTNAQGRNVSAGQPNPKYSLFDQYTVATRNGTYFVYPQFREALGPLPRRCNLHVAVDGHGEYFLLLVKQPNPGQGQEENAWYTTARTVAAAAMKGWVKVTKPGGDRGWGYVPIQHKMFDPTWPTKPFEDLLNAAFPEHVIMSLNHDLIQQYKERGA